MKTLHTHGLEMEKKFDEEFVVDTDPEEHKIVAFYSDEEGFEFWSDYKIKNFITNQNKQLYIKIAEGELKRHIKQMKVNIDIIENHTHCPKDWHEGRIEEAQSNFDYWNNILQELNK